MTQQKNEKNKKNEMMLQLNQVLERCGSTNEEAKKLAEQGVPHGTWISTRVQEQGRGRLGRSWESIEGNLFLSLIIKEVDLSLWSWIPLTTATACTEYLRSRYPDIPVGIKWPNDLVIKDAKLGGILCEGSLSTSNSENYIIVGVGINCAAAPESLDQATIALTSMSGGRFIHADEIRREIILAILQNIKQLQEFGSGHISKKYEKWTVTGVGTGIIWGNKESFSKESSHNREGKILGLGPASELLVITSQGEHLSLFAEDVKVVPKYYSDSNR